VYLVALFYLLVGNDSSDKDSMIQYILHWWLYFDLQRAVHIERYVHVLPGPIASRISQTSECLILFREILYNLTNYYLYDDRFIQVPSFKGQATYTCQCAEIDNEVYNARFRKH
jgi:hypothetical protein